MKNSDLNEKIGNYHDKKNYIIAMSNNTPEATTEQQQQRNKKTTKSAKKKLDGVMKKYTEKIDLQKMVRD